MFGLDVDKWAKEKVVSHNGYRTKKFIYCTECGQYFDNTGVKDGRKEECPHCGTQLVITTSKKRTDKEERYFCLVDKFDEYQVFRYVYICRTNNHGKPVHYFIDEVMQKWMSLDGAVTIVAKSRLMCSSYSFDGWSHGSDMEIREQGNYYHSFGYSVCVYLTYPKQKWMAEYKKFGVNKQIKDVDPYWLLRTVKYNPSAETLLKARQYSLLAYMANGNRNFIETNWPTIKICMRNKYIVKDASMYADYIRLLDRYHKDLRNAHYVCPKDLNAAHDIYVEKRKKEQEREEKKRNEQRLLRQKKAEKEFEKLKSKFFDLNLSDGKIVIVVLKTLEDFKEEGDAMKHCVFTNEYFKKKDSLILSARIGDKRIETIELNLKTLQVVQSRGVCNQNTEYHDRIISLVNKNINLIRRKLTA